VKTRAAFSNFARRFSNRYWLTSFFASTQRPQLDAIRKSLRLYSRLWGGTCRVGNPKASKVANNARGAAQPQQELSVGFNARLVPEFVIKLATGATALFMGLR
jgi:hypothetical protein